jgi:aspartyl-tRNA(Asn)/glutamyl-tRNA(Gln) amidotransferase subunit A
LTYRSLIALQADLLAGATSSIKVVQNYLEAINTNKELNAFIEVFDEDAITRAQLLDKKIQAKEKLGDLFGLVIGIKDNIVFKNHKATAGSKILQGYTSVFSATVIDRLLEQDAIIIGRLNCDEFAMGSSSENTFYGNVQNPL